MLVDEGFADAVAADFGEVLEKPAWRDAAIDGEEMQWPGDRVVQWPLPCKADVGWEAAVACRKVLPCLHGYRRMLAPNRRGQLLQKRILALREGSEGKLPRRLVHQPWIVAEVPALHDGADIQLVHRLVLLVQIAGDGDERDGSVLVGTPHL